MSVVIQGSQGYCEQNQPQRRGHLPDRRAGVCDSRVRAQISRQRCWVAAAAISAAIFPDIASTSTSNGGTIAASVIANQLYVDFRGWAFVNGDTATVTFAEVATPLPATLPLFVSGLAAVVYLSRRRAGHSGAG